MRAPGTGGAAAVLEEACRATVCQGQVETTCDAHGLLYRPWMVSNLQVGQGTWSK